MVDEEIESPEEEQSSGMPGKTRMMIIGAIIAVQIPIVVLIGNKLIKPMLVDPDSTTAVLETRGTIFMMEDITVNLVSARRSRFLRLSVGLEVEDPNVILELEERTPEIRDAIISSVSGRKVDELISVNGKEQLKAELKERIDAKLQKGGILRVYFNDFVVQ